MIVFCIKILLQQWRELRGKSHASKKTSKEKLGVPWYLNVPVVLRQQAPENKY